LTGLSINLSSGDTMSGFRKDNRVFEFPRFDRTGFEAAGASAVHDLDMQMTGREPLLVWVDGGDADVAYSSTGPWITIPDGTFMNWMKDHPFRGDVYFRCTTAAELPTVKICFMIGGYVNVEG